MKKLILLMILLTLITLYLLFLPLPFVSKQSSYSPHALVDGPDIDHTPVTIEYTSSVMNVIKIQSLILERDYAGLNEWIESCQKAAEEDVVKDGNKTLEAVWFFSDNEIEYAWLLYKWTLDWFCRIY